MVLQQSPVTAQHEVSQQHTEAKRKKQELQRRQAESRWKSLEDSSPARQSPRGSPTIPTGSHGKSYKKAQAMIPASRLRELERVFEAFDPTQVGKVTAVQLRDLIPFRRHAKTAGFGEDQARKLVARAEKAGGALERGELLLYLDEKLTEEPFAFKARRTDLPPRRILY